MKLSTVLSLLLVLALCLSAVGCGKGIGKSDAKEMVESFLAAVAGGDFEEAKSYLHPDRPYDVAQFFGRIEERMGIDFQKGIEIERYTAYSSSMYDSEVDGSDFDLEMRVTVDGASFEMSFEIVKNDRGYGIYEIDLD